MRIQGQAENGQHKQGDDAMQFHVTIRSKIAVYMGIDPYICGNSDYTIRFDFDEEWAAHETKTARFVKQDGTYQDQVFTGNICPVPVISNTWGIMVGVFAGNLHTTTSAYIPAKKSILCASGMPSAPSDDVYAQIMQKIDNGLLKGEKGDKGEPGEPGEKGEPGEPGKDGKDAAPYTLPTASAEVKGGVKVGKGLRMDGDVLGVNLDGMVPIEEIVLNSRVSSFTKDVTPDGKPYNFRRMIIIVYKPAVESTGYMWLQINATDIDNVTHNLLAASTAGNGARLVLHYVSIVAGKVLAVSTNTASTSYVEEVTWQSARGARMTLEATAIRSIHYNGGVFPEGTKIEIYGEWM